jgi:hypothetical protein
MVKRGNFGEISDKTPISDVVDFGQLENFSRGGESSPPFSPRQLLTPSPPITCDNTHNAELLTAEKPSVYGEIRQ